MNDDLGNQLIIQTLSEIKDDIREVRSSMSHIKEQQAKSREDIASLKVKASMWGGLSGMVSFVVMLIGSWIKGRV